MQKHNDPSWVKSHNCLTDKIAIDRIAKTTAKFKAANNFAGYIYSGSFQLTMYLCSESFQ